MIKITYRPITDDERRMLTLRLQPLGVKGTLVVEGASLGCATLILSPLIVIGAIAAWSLGMRSTFGWSAFAAGVLLSAVCIRVFVMTGGKKEMQEHKDVVTKQLSESRVEVLHCTATEAIQVEEVDDEGVGYYLNVGDGKMSSTKITDAVPPVL